MVDQLKEAIMKNSEKSNAFFEYLVVVSLAIPVAGAAAPVLTPQVGERSSVELSSSSRQDLGNLADVALQEASALDGMTLVKPWLYRAFPDTSYVRYNRD